MSVCACVYVTEKKENASERKKEKKSGILEDRVRPNLSFI